MKGDYDSDEGALCIKLPLNQSEVYFLNRRVSEPVNAYLESRSSLHAASLSDRLQLIEDLEEGPINPLLRPQRNSSAQDCAPEGRGGR